MSRYTIKLLEQDLIRTPEGIYFSLNEPLKFFGKASNDKLVRIAVGSINDDKMTRVRREIWSRYVNTTVDFWLERIPNMGTYTDAHNATKVYVLANQLDPTVSHTFNVRGQLETIFRILSKALVGHNSNVYTVTIEPATL